MPPASAPTSPRLTLRPLARSDFALLSRWLSQPHVARWWNHETRPAALEQDFGPSIDGADKAEIFIASLVDGRVDGWIDHEPVVDAPVVDPSALEELTADVQTALAQIGGAQCADVQNERPANPWPIGLIQRYTFADNPGYIEELAPLLAVPGTALSMDYFIGEPAALHRGLGSAMLRAALQSTWPAYPNAPAVIVPVVVANTASWRMLERIGFRRVASGLLTPDNPVDEPDHYVYQIDRA